MNRNRILTLVLGILLLFTADLATALDPGFLVLAPDRGFLGNEEVRDLFAEFRKSAPKSVLAFATSEKTAQNLRLALDKLAGGKNADVVVLPLFFSEHEALYQKARKAMESINGPALRFARPFGASYLAEEILFDRVESLSSQPGQERLILVASGTESEEAASYLKEDLKPLLDRAVKKYGLGQGGDIVVIHDWSAPKEIRDAAFNTAVSRIRDSFAQFPRTLVVPFNFGKKLDSMMSDWNRVQRAIKAHDVTGPTNVVSATGHHKTRHDTHQAARQSKVAHNGDGILPHLNVLYWLKQASASYLPLKRNEIGVILVAHGADYNWNETMREAIEPLRSEYITEDAFSMVDPATVERAVRRLEKRGVKAAVLVRIFSLEASFQEQTEYMLGLQRHQGGDGEHGGDHGGWPMRIRSGLLFHTLGGVEANPQLARSLVDRIREISRNPEKETVILLAHGVDDERQNDHWMSNLGTLAEYIRQNNGGRFRAIRYYAWREDWPEKREKAVKVIRSMVEEASKDGGIALIVPDRTNGRGPTDEFLEGLTYRHAEGFAPSQHFTDWLRSMIEKGISHLTDTTTR